MIMTDEQLVARQDAINKEEKSEKVKKSPTCKEILENNNEEFDEFDINDCLEIKGDLLLLTIIFQENYCFINSLIRHFLRT